MKKNSLTFSVLFVALVFMVIMRNAVKNNKFTCSNYIMNTYTYIILGIGIVYFIVELLENNSKIAKTSGMFVFSSIFLFLILFALMWTSPDQLLLRHVLWTTFVILIGITVFPLVSDMKKSGNFNSALMSTALITIGIALFAYKNPNKNLTKNWHPYLFIGLIGLILLQLFNRLLDTKEWSWISYVCVVLFSAMLLHDTERLNMIAKACKEGVKVPNIKNIPPDYIRDSLSIFLNIINLFTGFR